MNGLIILLALNTVAILILAYSVYRLSKNVGYNTTYHACSFKTAEGSMEIPSGGEEWTVE